MATPKSREPPYTGGELQDISQRVAFKYARPCLRDDAASEFVTAALTAAAAVASADNPRAYQYSCGKNAVQKFCKRNDKAEVPIYDCPEENFPAPDDDPSLACSLKEMTGFISDLPTDEQEVLTLLWGLKGREKVPRRKVAAIYRRSGAWVREIEEKALDRLNRRFLRPNISE